jgi:hypothetical protein
MFSLVRRGIRALSVVLDGATGVGPVEPADMAVTDGIVHRRQLSRHGHLGCRVCGGGGCSVPLPLIALGLDSQLPIGELGALSDNGWVYLIFTEVRMVLGQTGVREVLAEDNSKHVPDPIAELGGQCFCTVVRNPVTCTLISAISSSHQATTANKQTYQILPCAVRLPPVMLWQISASPGFTFSLTALPGSVCAEKNIVSFVPSLFHQISSGYWPFLACSS